MLISNRLFETELTLASCIAYKILGERPGVDQADSGSGLFEAESTLASCIAYTNSWEALPGVFIRQPTF